VSWPKAPTYHWSVQDAGRAVADERRLADEEVGEREAGRLAVEVESPAARALLPFARSSATSSRRSQAVASAHHEKSSPAWYDAFARRTLTELPRNRESVGHRDADDAGT